MKQSRVERLASYCSTRLFFSAWATVSVRLAEPSLESLLTSNAMMLDLPMCSLNRIMAPKGKLVLTSMLPIIYVIGHT